MQLKNKKWYEFEIDKLFSQKRGSLIGLSKNKSRRGTRIISANTNNNGFSHYEDKKPNFKGNVFTIANTGQGSVGVVFYQDEPFIPTNNITVLIPKFNINKNIAMFLLPLFKRERYRLSFGRILNEKRLKKHKIKLPVNSNGKPDWRFMETYVKMLDTKNILQKDINELRNPFNKKGVELEEEKFKRFTYSELFSIKKGERIVVSKILKRGNCPFVSAIDKNNGVSYKLSIKPNHKSNTITVNYDGNGVAEAYYQFEPYFALDSVNVLYPKFDLNPFIAMFLITLIKKEKFKFSYGRKWHKERMEKSIIKLPVNKKNNPDWQFIENYIKSLPYSKALTK